MTAEQYRIENANYDLSEGDCAEKLMQEYAKLKCQELLEIVAEKAEVKEYFELNYEWTYTVDKDSILNAVDLDSFIV